MNKSREEHLRYTLVFTQRKFTFKDLAALVFEDLPLFPPSQSRLKHTVRGGYERNKSREDHHSYTLVFAQRKFTFKDHVVPVFEDFPLQHQMCTVLFGPLVGHHGTHFHNFSHYFFWQLVEWGSTCQQVSSPFRL
jgi:hypothetical protein